MFARSKKEFITLFDEIVDFRDDCRILYPLSEILFLCLIGTLCGAEGWDELEDFGNLKLEFLRKYFQYEHGVPSKYTISRLIGLIDKKYFESWLSNWTIAMFEDLNNEIIAIDGKSLRGKLKFSDKFQASHVVSMFATKAGLVLSQTTVPEKTNEITAIKDLIKSSNIKGATISIDAIGCQWEIADLIVEKEANYFLALKQNQGNLYSDVESHLNYLINKCCDNVSFFEDLDKGHGRVEVRRCYAASIDPKKIGISDKWKTIKSICMVESERHIKNKVEIAKRYYISSKNMIAEEQLKCSRSHWGIENNLHWVLDVQFKEDDSLIRQKYAAENMSVIRKLILNLVKKYKKKADIKTSKKSVRRLRFGAALSNDVLENLLNDWEVN